MATCDCGSAKTYGKDTNLHAPWCAMVAAERARDWELFQSQNIYYDYYTYYWVTGSPWRRAGQFVLDVVEAEKRIPLASTVEFWLEDSLANLDDLIQLCKNHNRKYKIVCA